MKSIMLTISVLSGGGAERVVCHWANILSTYGYKVSILVNGRVNNEYKVLDDVNIISLCDKFEEYHNLKLSKKISLRRKALKKVKPDFLISFLPYIQVLSLISSFGLRIRRIETVRISP